MSANNFENVVSGLVKGMNSFLSTKTVMGSPVQVGDATIIPLVDVSFGVGAGASDGDKKSVGGGGLSGKMSPSAVLVIKDGQTKLVNIKNQDTLNKIVDMVPDIIDKFTTPKEAMPKDEDVVDAAFPDLDA